jgi:enediyne polyketide synthase
LNEPIAIVGMACRYPDAVSSEALWETIIAERRAFRAIPPERLRLSDYGAAQSPCDSTYVREAAVLEGFELDRERHRVSGSNHRAADVVHWLALEVATAALEDAGFSGGAELPRATTGVLIGNSLTGEQSRAASLRLRWPFVRRVVGEQLERRGMPSEEMTDLLRDLEVAFKAPFAEPTEETLAGGMSNTIAGRICNMLDLGGGGFTVDGACSSSLLAIAQACRALSAGDLDVAVAGGVDVSLDPFELVGFARTGALASGAMRVYDRRPTGFLPGEGCGIVILVRARDAVERGLRVRAVLRGWGISSDGAGGLTRPEVGGQRLALQRAYAAAGWSMAETPYFEGHGTGTAVGDATELRALCEELRAAVGPRNGPAAIGSIKTLIGHTKAAAGAAGLIKAVLSLEHQVVPATVGSESPHAVVDEHPDVLRTVPAPEPWPASRPLRAGVSAMGFGGINVHVALEAASERRAFLTPSDRRLVASRQDAEILVLSASSRSTLRDQLDQLRPSRLSHAELADLSTTLSKPTPGMRVRAAIVARSPMQAQAAVDKILAWLAEGPCAQLDHEAGAFLWEGTRAPRIGFLFTGQGVIPPRATGLWGRRFPELVELYESGAPRAEDDLRATDVMQPAIVASSLACLELLRRAGIEADVAVGHSLGELSALAWAGALDAWSAVGLARTRGRLMSETHRDGAMVSLAVSVEEAEAFLAPGLVIAAINGPASTVLAGREAVVEAAAARARAVGISAHRLAVSHAFHSPLVAPAAPSLRESLERMKLSPLERSVVSTVTAKPLEADADVRALLTEQLTAPVRLAEALAAAGPVDLFIEVGIGEALAGLAAAQTSAVTTSPRAFGPSLRGLLETMATAFVMGAPVQPARLLGDRFTRPFALDRRWRFITNPCESAPVDTLTLPSALPREERPDDLVVRAAPGTDALGVLTALIAERLELPEAVVQTQMRLLEDLHLSSIAVSQIVGEAARRLSLPAPAGPGEFTRATVGDLAATLEQLVSFPMATDVGGPPAGMGDWIRPYRVKLVERSARPRVLEDSGEWTVCGEHPQGPALAAALSRAECGRGVAVWLGEASEATRVAILLEASKRLRDGGPGTRFLLVESGVSSAAFARCVHVETGAPTVVVRLDGAADPIAAVVGEVARASRGYSETHYVEGRPHEPSLELIERAEPTAPTRLAEDDVVLVTGGGKGVAAECALDLARHLHVRLALLGRSRPEDDAELTANLARMRDAGVRAEYAVADVTSAAEVSRAVAALQRRLGAVRAVVHGAGINLPRPLVELDEEAFLATVRPKTDGLRNVLDAVDRADLSLVVAFGSIIARVGLEGEADYAVANEWLRELVDDFGRSYPACRAVTLEWSLWSGTGMGERLARVELLRRRDIAAMSVEQAVATFRQLVGADLPSAVVVTGRFGRPPTLRQDGLEPPILRFLEEPRAHYPGVEIVADARLDVAADGYLRDHVFEGVPLMPAVMGIEAMAQAAVTLRPSALGVIRDVELLRPVAVASDTLTVRTAALVVGTGVEVALRSETTSHAVDHFQSRFEPGNVAPLSELTLPVHEPVPLDVDALYDALLFQRGRFRRIRAYRRLEARQCLVELHPGRRDASWFGPFQPTELVLGDPGVRDAALHALQACIPDAVVLPRRIECIELFGAVDEVVFVEGRERHDDGRDLVWDLDLARADGVIVERWRGVHLRRLRDVPLVPLPALLGPCVQRRLEALVGGDLRVVSAPSTADRRATADALLRRASRDEAAPIHRRPDGRPDRINGHHVSVSHAGEVTVAVAADAPVACDLEMVVDRSEAAWHDLLGPRGLALADEMALEGARTFAWVARECLAKLGSRDGAALTVESVGPAAAVLRAGANRVATALVPRGSGSLAFAVGLRERP